MQIPASLPTEQYVTNARDLLPLHGNNCRANDIETLFKQHSKLGKNMTTESTERQIQSISK